MRHLRFSNSLEFIKDNHSGVTSEWAIMKLEEELEYYSEDEIEDFELTREELFSIDVDDELGEYYALQDEDSDPFLIKRRDHVLDKMVRDGRMTILPTCEWKCGNCGQENSREDSFCFCCGISHLELPENA